MARQDDQICKLITAIFTVHQSETIDCETCSAQFECLVEMVNSGAQMRDILPAVEDHLRCCPDCNEEYQALLTIIRAESDGSLTQTAL